MHQRTPLVEFFFDLGCKLLRGVSYNFGSLALHTAHDIRVQQRGACFRMKPGDEDGRDA